MSDRLRNRGLAAGICLLLIAGLLQPAAAQDPTQRFIGIWQGTLQVQDVGLRLTFAITRDSAGGLAGSFTSIDQGGVTLPFTIRVAGDSIRAEAADIGAVFTGRLAAADSIGGTWSQNGYSFPLSLKRVAQAGARGPRVAPGEALAASAAALREVVPTSARSNTFASSLLFKHTAADSRAEYARIEERT